MKRRVACRARQRRAGRRCEQCGQFLPVLGRETQATASGSKAGRPAAPAAPAHLVDGDGLGLDGQRAVDRGGAAAKGHLLAGEVDDEDVGRVVRVGSDGQGRQGNDEVHADGHCGRLVGVERWAVWEGIQSSARRERERRRSRRRQSVGREQRRAAA